MSIQAPVLDKSDPKSEVLYPFHLPASPEWKEKQDLFGNSAMMMAGGGMFMKNPLIVWISVIVASVSFVNNEPLRKSKEAQSPLASLALSLAGVLATSFPKMMLALEQPKPAASV